ncbi:hypothetical protein HN51_008229, partial [Arachis hypogaea]
MFVIANANSGVPIRTYLKSWLNLLENSDFKSVYYENLKSKSAYSSSLLLWREYDDRSDGHVREYDDGNDGDDFNDGNDGDDFNDGSDGDNFDDGSDGDDFDDESVEHVVHHQYDVHLLSGERYENMVTLILPSLFEEYIPGTIADCVNGIICHYEQSDYVVKIGLWNPKTDEHKIIPPCVIPGEQMFNPCHWRGREYWKRGWRNGEEVIVSFNLSTKTFQTTSIAWLQSNYGRFLTRALVVLNESLALISSFVENSRIEIFILGEVGVEESWVKLFTIGPFLKVDLLMEIGNKCDVIFYIRSYNDELASFDVITSKVAHNIGIKAGNGGAMEKKENKIKIDSLMRFEKKVERKWIWWQCVKYMSNTNMYAIGGYVTKYAGQVKCYMENLVSECSR